MRVPIRDMLFVIRAAGERTQHACVGWTRRLIARAEGDPASQLVLVQERPFSRAVRATFEVGRASGRRWVVGIDADVLLLDDAIERLAAVCACMDGGAFVATPLLLCKFFGGICCKGVHIYPARLMERAIGMIDSSGSAVDLKPESAVVRAMQSRGFPAQGPPVVVGVHDFEQSYRHIYLKARLRARREAAAPEFDSIDFVRRLAAHDTDMLVASWGMEDGRADASRDDAPPSYDWDAPYPELDARARAHTLADKPELARDPAGYARYVITGHDFAHDRRTPEWIRQRFDFSGDRDVVLERLGLRSAARGSALRIDGRAA